MRASSVESAILDTLNCDGCHRTAREILDVIRPRLPAVNSSTVYRALDRLVTAAKISVSDMGQGAAVYEQVQSHPHHHLVCQNCGKIEYLDGEIVEDFLQQISQNSAYQITTNHLVIFGICSICQQDS
jgi:Fur family ferric uptake transcriptional regulator